MGKRYSFQNAKNDYTPPPKGGEEKKKLKKKKKKISGKVQT
jgi:hypothetical protein